VGAFSKWFPVVLAALSSAMDRTQRSEWHRQPRSALNRALV